MPPCVQAVIQCNSLMRLLDVDVQVSSFLCTTTGKTDSNVYSQNFNNLYTKATLHVALADVIV